LVAKGLCLRRIALQPSEHRCGTRLKRCKQFGWVAGNLLAGALRRAAAARAQGTGEQVAGDPAELLAALQAGAASVLAGLQSDTPQTQALCDQIDALRDGPIQGLVECKEAMVARHGMLAFAEFISVVSAGERNLNRAWSTLVDGYPAEALKAAERAQGALEHLSLPGAA